MSPEYLALWERWHQEHGCTHTHCPRGCEHPQPMLISNGRMLCQACWHRDRTITECVPCVKGVCDDR